MKISINPKDFWELIISHHPQHPCFKNDVIIIFGRRICAGCIFAYPTAFIVFMVFNPSGFEAIIAAIALAIFSQVRRLSNNRYINFAFRLVAGMALGFGVGGLLWAVQTRDVPAAFLIILAGCVYAIVRYYSMASRMRECTKNDSE